MKATRNQTRWYQPVLAAGFAMLAVAGSAPAQPPDGENDGRGVARMSVMSGEVSVRRADSGDWVAAALNAPLMTPDRVATGGNASHAEIQFDWANFARLAVNTEIQLSDLDNGHFQVQVAGGTVTYRILRDSEAQPEIVTPMVSVRPLRKGMYRITVLDDGQTAVTVRSGEAEIATPRGVERLGPGQTMQLRGAPADPEFQISRAFDEDDWDRWNRARDRDLERRAESYNYASRDEYGVEDLDGQGRWVNEPEYGYVWAPAVAAGWAPYRNGRWVWLDFYGWSWVSYDPWGWAPYHYGRWFYRASIGWCWWPGGMRVRHYWAPAHVAFFGWGSPGFHSGFSFGFGNVGWVPLAPYEAQHRWWGRNYYGANRTVINVTSVNVTSVYRNARFNGVTAVNADGFARGRSGYAFRGDAELRQANLVRGQLPVTPGRESLRLSDREVRGPAVDRVEGRQFFSRRQPAQTARVSFEDQRRTIDQATRQSFGGQVPRDGVIRPNDSRLYDARSNESPRQSRSDSGWRRFGEPPADRVRHESGLADRPAAAREDGRRAQREVPEGWRRFGDAARPETQNFQQAERPRFEGRVDSGARPERIPGRNSGRNPAVDFGGAPPRLEAPAPAVPRMEPREERRGRERSDRFGGGSAESIRINPPVVRERAMPAGNFGGGAPRPQMERAPRMEAPRGGPPEMRGGGGRSESRGGPPEMRGGGGRSESRGGGRSDSGGGGRGGRGR